VAYQSPLSDRVTAITLFSMKSCLTLLLPNRFTGGFFVCIINKV
jgi:hypothetical protein